MSTPNSNQQRIVTADMLKHLPEPAQRYLNYTGVVGKPWINTVRIKYTGIFRLAADKPWMPIKAEQFYTDQSARLSLESALQDVRPVDGERQRHVQSRARSHVRQSGRSLHHLRCARRRNWIRAR